MTSAGAATPENAVATPLPAVSSPAAIDAALTALAVAAPLLLVIDFDGTLAVGSRDPAVARIEPLGRDAA